MLTIVNRVTCTRTRATGLPLVDAITGIGLAEQVAVVARGSLSGTVLLSSIDTEGTSNIARLRVAAPGVVVDEGQLALPEGYENMPRAGAVQP